MPRPAVPVLGSPGFVAAKAGLASGVALLGCALLGNQDHVSSAFVAVVCVSPTVLIGARLAAQQLLGSGLGGAFGTLAAAAGLPSDVGIPLAVGASVFTALRAGLGSAWNVTAFTALFVQAVPRGLPTHTLGVRMQAVLIAVVAASLVNAVVSGHTYRTIFDKRLARLERYVPDVLAWAAEVGPAAYPPAFGALSAVDDELGQALEELRWRRSRDLAVVGAMRARLAGLRHLLHVALDLQERAEEVGVPLADVAPLIAWAASGDGDAPPVAPPLDEARQRLVSARRALPRGAAAA